MWGQGGCGGWKHYVEGVDPPPTPPQQQQQAVGAPMASSWQRPPEAAFCIFFFSYLLLPFQFLRSWESFHGVECQKQTGKEKNPKYGWGKPLVIIWSLVLTETRNEGEVNASGNKKNNFTVAVLRMETQGKPTGFSWKVLFSQKGHFSTGKSFKIKYLYLYYQSLFVRADCIKSWYGVLPIVALWKVAPCNLCAKIPPQTWVGWLNSMSKYPWIREQWKRWKK